MKMTNLKDVLKVSGAITLAGSVANAQTPLFTGMAGKPISLEARAHVGEETPNYMGFAKFFPKSIPAWAYIGNTYNQGELGESLYGFGPVINIKDRAYFLPTLEGAGGKPNQFSLYSTFDLGHGRYIDINPLIRENEKPIINFNVHKKVGGVTVGMSSDFSNGQFRRERDTDFRVVRFDNGNFVDLGVNFGKRKVRIAVQRAFGGN